MRRLAVWLLAPAVSAMVSLSIIGGWQLGANAANRTQYPWKGHDAACSVRLPTPGFVKYGQFTTCPPKRVLFVGDSVALTMSIQTAIDEENYGTIVDGVSMNGCGFVAGYDLEFSGRYVPQGTACATASSTWAADARRFKAQAVIVEMGWWDSHQHNVNGTIESLGDPQYDTLVEQQMQGLIHALRSATAGPIYLLSVPWMSPAALPNGQPEPAASAANHAEINSLLQAAATSSSGVHFVDIAPYLTPSGQFQSKVNGTVCRESDGIHLYYAPNGSLRYVHTSCGQALQRGILSRIRQDLSHT